MSFSRRVNAESALPRTTSAPSTDAQPSVSDETRRDVALSERDLWLRYFELGGMSTQAEVDAYLHHGVTPPTHDHEVLAQALDERLSDLGRDQRIPRRSLSLVPSPPGDFAGKDPSVQLQVLGSFSLRVNGEEIHVPMNAQRLVTFLALHGGSVLRTHVAGSLWSGSTDSNAAGSLRSALWRLGRLADPLIEVTDAHLRLCANVDVDLQTSEEFVRRVLDDSQDLTARLDTSLLSSDVLPDWTDDWVLVRREHHAQLRLRALEVLCRRLSEVGRFDLAVQAGLLAVSGEPLRESARRTLVAAHLAEGNVVAAADQYHTFRDLLHKELGMQPSEQMRLLAQAFVDDGQVRARAHDER